MPTTIIDTNHDTTSRLAALKALGVRTIIRYINPLGQGGEKTVKPVEARAIAAMDMRLGLVCEGWGDFAHNGINRAAGDRDGERCRDYALSIGAPPGAAIYFAVDVDCTDAEIRSNVLPYFAEVKKDLAGVFRVGVYGPGAVCQAVLDAGYAELAWLSNATGWNGTHAFHSSGRWDLLQHLPADIAGLDTDPNEGNPNRPGAGTDIGDFRPFGGVIVNPPPGPGPLPTDALWIQMALNKRGAKLVEDGKIGPASLGAIRRFIEASDPPIKATPIKATIEATPEGKAQWTAPTTQWPMTTSGNIS